MAAAGAAVAFSDAWCLDIGFENDLAFSGHEDWGSLDVVPNCTLRRLRSRKGRHFSGDGKPRLRPKFPLVV